MKNPNQKDLEDVYENICRFIETSSPNKPLAISKLNQLLFRRIEDFEHATNSCIKKGTFLLKGKYFTTKSSVTRQELGLPKKGKGSLSIKAYQTTFSINLENPTSKLVDLMSLYSKHAGNSELGEEKLCMMIDHIWHFYQPTFMAVTYFNTIPFILLMIQGMLIHKDEVSHVLSWA
jgi:hypothetical protein